MNKLFFLMLTLLIFQNPLEQELSVFGYMDELFGLLIVPILIYQIFRKNRKIKLDREQLIPICLLAGVILTGSIGYVLHHYQPFSNTVKDAYVNVKFYLTMGVGYLLFESCDFEKSKKEIFWGTNLITAVLFILFIVDMIFHIYPASSRWGMRAIQLFYNSNTSLVAQGVLICAVYLKLYEYMKMKILPGLGMICLVIVATIRFKAIIAVFCVIVILILVCYKGKKLNKTSGILLTSAVLIIAAPQILYYIYGGINEQFARPVLIVTSLYFGIHYFPFGTGWGTFGSHFSIEPYSPIYGMYKMAGVWGLSEKHPQFVSDNFWPMILGQCGIIGFMFYIALVVILVKRVLKLGHYNLYSYASGLLLIVYLLLCTTSESAFAGPASISAALFLGALFAESDGMKEAKHE